MATLSATLTLESLDATSDELSVSVSDSLTTTYPSVGVSRAVLTTSPTNLVPTSSSAIVYFYAKNTDSTQTVVFETIDGTQAFSDLSPEEVCFFPIKGTIGVRAKSGASTAVLEYAYWTKG